jgi:hypothetical protein
MVLSTSISAVNCKFGCMALKSVRILWMSVCVCGNTNSCVKATLYALTFYQY